MNELSSTTWKGPGEQVISESLSLVTDPTHLFAISDHQLSQPRKSSSPTLPDSFPAPMLLNNPPRVHVHTCPHFSAKHGQPLLLRPADPRSTAPASLVNTQPNLFVIPSIKAVINADHDDSKVALICGGGSSHEPGSTGCVGRGLLSASVCGDVFSSPSIGR